MNVRVCAGEASLDAPVRWVHISEIVDPTPFLSGGELLLTTGMQLSDPGTQREFVLRLADHGLSGLGFGVGFGHETLPAAVVAAAEERDFALFEIPYDMPFIALTEHAFTRLGNEHHAVLRRAISAHERLERLVLSQRGLDAVAGALATLIGGGVMVCDARGQCTVKRAFRRALEDDTVEAVSAELRERARAGETRSFVPSTTELAGRALALPVGPGESGGVPPAGVPAGQGPGRPPGVAPPRAPPGGAHRPP